MGKIDSSFYDDEDLINIPKELLFRIFDVCDGSLLNEFEICNGILFFDKLLYCSSQVIGFRVYDISNGKLLFKDKIFYPKVYHSKSKEFLEITDNEITICKFFEEEWNFS
ncbi:hypothetical protein PUR_45670 [Paenibacillus sp. URB8-2]|nr:hypothetical protein PUR_45670 [Paenibacillus sp. URB8-2]